ncbi:hypothetical protein L9F63_009405, partial [Diploptera punctata]
IKFDPKSLTFSHQNISPFLMLSSSVPFLLNLFVLIYMYPMKLRLLPFLNNNLGKNSPAVDLFICNLSISIFSRLKEHIACFFTK